MTSQITDDAVLEGLARAAGHAPPFSASELSNLDGTVSIVGARSLAGLEVCRALRGLEVIGSELSDTSPLVGMAGLRDLLIACSRVADYDGIAASHVESLQFHFCGTEDSAWLRQLRGLKRASLLGNPWTEEAYKALTSGQLLNTRQVAMDLPSKAEWKNCRELFVAAAPACFGTLDNTTFVVRPGMSTIASKIDAIQVPHSMIEFALRHDEVDVSTWFAEFAPRQSVAPSDFRSHCIVDLPERLAARLSRARVSPDERERLLGFIERFGDQGLYYNDPGLFENLRHRAGISLPKWFRKARGWVGLVRPREVVQVRFERFQYRSALSEVEQPIWYELGLLGAEPERRDLVKGNKIFPIGVWSDTGLSTLCIRLNESDQNVYHYNEHVLGEDQRLTRQDLSPVFGSYFEMLAAISQIRLGDGTVIEPSALQRT